MSAYKFVEAAVAGQNQTWRYLLSLFLTTLFTLLGVLLLVGAAVLVFLMVAGGHGLRDYSDSAKLFETEHGGLILLVLFLLSVFLLAPATMLAIRIAHRRPASSLFLRDRAFRWGLFAKSTGAGLAGFAAISAIYALCSPGEIEVVKDPEKYLPFVLVVALLMPLQAFGEEVLFRGYLLQGVAWFSARWGIRLAVPAVLFTMAHLPGLDKFVQGTGYVGYVFAYAVTAFYLTWLAIRTDGIEQCWGLHIANNFIALLILSDETSLVWWPTLFYEHDAVPEVTPLLVIGAFAVHYWLAVRPAFPGLRSPDAG